MKNLKIIKKSKHILVFTLLLLFCINTNQAQTWTEKNEDESYTGRHECGFTQVGDKFFLFGGRESPRVIDIYDYATDSWTQGGMAPVDFNHFQAITYEGLIWVIGAFKTNTPNPEQSADYIYMYNPATEQWIQGMEIPNARKRGSAGLVIYNNTFFLVCGNNNGHSGGYVSYFDSFDPQTGTWSELNNAPRPRDHFQAAVFQDKLYAIGGRLTGGAGGLFEPQVLEIDVYDFATETWSTLGTSSNIPYPRAGLGVSVFNNEIYTMGGETTFNRVGNGQVDVVESFNPITGLWTTRNSLNYRRHGFQPIVSGNAIYVIGGSEGGSAMKNMEYYATDSPTGSPNVNSSFQPDETTKTFTYEEDDNTVNIDITLSNSLGTTGTYIDNIEVSGDNFTLLQSYSNLLLGASSNLTVTIILNNTTAEESNGTVTVTYNNNASLTINLEGELDGTLSVNSELNSKQKLLIYPDPVKNTFHINKEISSLEIYDLSGRLIKTFNGHFNTKSSFNISELPANIYIVVARDNNNTRYNFKLIKQ